MHRRILALGSMALGLMAMVALPGLASAQQAPVPGWAIGKPEGSTLAPHAPRLTVTPADQVPTGSLRVPEGFKAELWAAGAPGARMMTQGPKGTVFVGTRAIGRVYAISTNADGTRRVRTIAQGLTQPNGVVMVGDSLFVFAVNRVLRYDNIEANLDAVSAPVELTAAFGLPDDKEHGGNHHWKFTILGPDGRIYTNVGAPCNICLPDRDRFALLVSFKPDGSDRRIEARGVRNSVGMAHHPVTKELWATSNQRDWAGNEEPEDKLFHIRRSGEDFGFPYCVGSWADPQENKGRSCSEFSQPAALLGPHVAALGMRFYTGTAFPEAYRNQIFIAQHGSWNRDKKSGYQVVVAKLDASGKVTSVEPFLTGLRDDGGNGFSGRPADVHMLPDGSLLVSDDQNGAIYRVSYGK